MLTDLERGRWALLRAEYEFYRTQAATWLDQQVDPHPDGVARADGVAWLWDNRASLHARQPRVFALSTGPAIVAWQPAATGGLDAIVAGPAFIATLCSAVVPSDLGCGLTDGEGRIVTGSHPDGRLAAVRTSAADGLPWVLHVSEQATSGVPGPSPRRRLLLVAFGVVALVLAAGWYFIVRAMSHELRVARLQADFVAAVSHEFRSPLTSMSHVADLLAGDRLPADTDRRRAYEVLLRETDRLRRLVEGLLDSGRFESGAGSLSLADVDVGELVRSTVAEFQQRVTSEGYAIDLSISGHARQARIDAEAVGRALWNLLDNAVKYSPECRQVSVDVSGDDSHVSIAVSDHGIGIPSGEQRHIFDRFARGSEATLRRIKGTGIGLAMVRDIVRAHGGEVHVSSVPGQGSCFTLTLPASPRPSHQAPAEDRMLSSVHGSR